MTHRQAVWLTVAGPAELRRILIGAVPIGALVLMALAGNEILAMRRAG